MKRYSLFIFAVLVFGFCFQVSVRADVYVANRGSAESVTVYPSSAQGNVAPVRTIAGILPGFNYPCSVTVDETNNELYVVNFFGKDIRVFPLNATGDVAPIRILADGPLSRIQQPRMVAVNPVTDEIFVACNNDSIRVFTRMASGDHFTKRVISGINTRIDNPLSIALDIAHNEVIVDSYDVGGIDVPGILVFDASASGDVAPLRIISGNVTSMGTFTNYVTLDLTHDEIIAQGNEGEGILVFDRTANGNVRPKRNITGGLTGLKDIDGILVDIPHDRIIAANGSENSLLVFSRMADGNKTPELKIGGALTGLSDPGGLAMNSTGGFTGYIPVMDPMCVIIMLLFAGMGMLYMLLRQADSGRKSEQTLF